MAHPAQGPRAACPECGIGVYPEHSRGARGCDLGPHISDHGHEPRAFRLDRRRRLLYACPQWCDVVTDIPEAALTEQVRQLALAAGAALVGFADIESLAELPRAVVLAMPHSPAVLTDPDDMPNPAYAQDYVDLNARLDEIATRIVDLLTAAGYRAVANLATLQTIDRATLAAPFAHKTAATRAGLGWIGKSALLVTPELGPALRLVSVMTDAPLVVGEPVTESRCGECVVCVEACPSGAIKGEQWHAGRPREEILDAYACGRTCLERAAARGIAGGRCGICMAVCPRRPA